MSAHLMKPPAAARSTAHRTIFTILTIPDFFIFLPGPAKTLIQQGFQLIPISGL